MISPANHVPLSPLSLLARARRAFACKVAAVDDDGADVSAGPGQGQPPLP